MVNGQQLTLTTGSLDRLEHLQRSLATWLKHPELDEVIVVDWDNEVPLLQCLNTFADPRVIVARVEGQRHWHNSKCHNLELQLASSEQVLRLDNDCLLKPNFFKRHELRSGHFFTGYWQDVSTGQHILTGQQYLTGTIYAYKSDLLTVNGYNERLRHYGREDDDLYDRLVARGLRRVDLDLSTLDHIPHSHAQRYEHLKIAGKIPPLLEKISEQQREEAAEHVVLNLIQMSSDVVAKKPWTSRDHVTKWKIEVLTPNYVTCEEVAGEEAEEPLAYVDSPPRPSPETTTNRPPSPPQLPPLQFNHDSPHGVIVASQAFGKGLPSNVNVH